MHVRTGSLRSSLLASSLMSSLFLSTLPAAAQDPAARAQAVQLFDAADQLMAQGKISAACPKYAASMKLDPQLGALLHLADCYAKNGQVASAWGSFREAEEMARMKNDERASLAHDQAAQLEPRLSHLTVVVPDSANLQGLEVRIDGSPITSGAWSTATPIDAGTHGVEARAAGYQSWSSSINVTGDAQDVHVEIPRLTEAAPTAPPSGGSPAPLRVQVDDSGSPIRTLGWVGIGVGAAGLGLGAVFLVQKNSKLSERDGICTECTQDQLDRQSSLTSDAKTDNTLSAVGFIVGGTLVVGGIAAVIFAPKPEAKTESAWLMPVAGPHILGFSGGLKW